MRNVAGYILNNWFDKLNGNISVPVYRTNVPAEERGNYVLLRMESDTYRGNNHSFVTRPVLIYEVVTRFQMAIDDGLANEIDDEVVQIMFTKPGASSIQQITEMRRESATYIDEDDGDEKYYRLAVRVSHRFSQTQPS